MTLPTQNPPTFPSHAVLTVIGEAIEVHEAMARDAAEDAAEEARLYGESFTQVVPPGDFDPSPGLDEPEDAVVLAQIDADADAWAAEMERRNPLAPFARPRG